MYEQSLIQTGLSFPQAIIYELLIKNGPQKAGKIALKSPFKRGLVYKTLEDLLKLDLIEKVENKGKVAVFAPKHPLQLRSLAERREQQARDAKLALEGMISSIVSDYNLVSGRPGVLFYEGLEGVKIVIEDTLINNDEKEIFVFSDVSSYIKNLREWNSKHYAPKRKRLGIKEKVIIPDHPDAIEYMKAYIKNPKFDTSTELLFIDHNIYPFKTEVNIYNNKVAFVTFSDKSHVGVIIENKDIYKAMLSIFNLSWELGQNNFNLNQPSWLKKFR